jgi:hypothetical protein
MNRIFAAALFGGIAVAYITIIALGYAHLGVLPRFGDFKPIAATQTLVSSVTPAGRAVGFRSGDIIDRTRLTMADRQILFQRAGIAGTHYAFHVMRAGSAARVSFELPATTGRRVGDAVDIVLRIMMMLTGLLLITRGRDSLSLYAGLWFATFAAFEGLQVVTYGVLGPVGVAIATALVGALGVAYFCFWFRFGYELLSRRVGRVTRAAFVLLLLSFLTMLIFSAVYVTLTTSSPWQLVSIAVGPVRSAVLLALILVCVTIAGVAALAAEREKTQSIRLIFWAVLIGAAGPAMNNLFTVIGVYQPFGYASNLTYLAAAVAIPYVLFTRRLAAIDFYVSKAAIYAIVIGVVVGIFLLIERLIEQLALGRTESAILQLLVPLVLGFSLKRIERGAEGFVERVLYRDKLLAAVRLNALIEDFPHILGTSALATRVVQEVHEFMRAPEVILFMDEAGAYVPAAEAGASPLRQPIDPNDPAFVRLRSTQRPVEVSAFHSALAGDGLLVPLSVFGSVTGMLYCRYRGSRERFDPDEVALLSRLAHELAAAIVWMERDMT